MSSARCDILLRRGHNGAVFKNLILYPRACWGLANDTIPPGTTGSGDHWYTATLRHSHPPHKTHSVSLFWPPLDIGLSISLTSLTLKDTFDWDAPEWLLPGSPRASYCMSEPITTERGSRRKALINKMGALLSMNDKSQFWPSYDRGDSPFILIFPAHTSLLWYISSSFVARFGHQYIVSYAWLILLCTLLLEGIRWQREI